MTTPAPIGSAAQRQFQVTVTGIDGLWAQSSGGEVTSATTDVWNGGAELPEKLAAPPLTANIKVTRPYNPQRDQPVIRALRPYVGRWRTTLTIQPTDADGIRFGDPDVYPNALLVNLNRPDADAGSGAAATMEMEFAVPGAV